mmetsp:Transcript_139183/g.433085  ORF Transcript_139183/g.433085 Transcript_139183/m.433085 type:complete len:247 (+) Transcript_139183:175-915(+)
MLSPQHISETQAKASAYCPSRAIIVLVMSIARRRSRQARTSSRRAASSCEVHPIGGGSASSDSRKPRCTARRGNSHRKRRMRPCPGPSTRRATGRRPGPIAEIRRLQSRSSNAASALPAPPSAQPPRPATGARGQLLTSNSATHNTSSTSPRSSDSTVMSASDRAACGCWLLRLAGADGGREAVPPVPGRPEARARSRISSSSARAATTSSGASAFARARRCSRLPPKAASSSSPWRESRWRGCAS